MLDNPLGENQHLPQRHSGGALNHHRGLIVFNWEWNRHMRQEHGLIHDQHREGDRPPSGAIAGDARLPFRRPRRLGRGGGGGGVNDWLNLLSHFFAWRCLFG